MGKRGKQVKKERVFELLNILDSFLMEARNNRTSLAIEIKAEYEKHQGWAPSVDESDYEENYWEWTTASIETMIDTLHEGLNNEYFE